MLIYTAEGRINCSFQHHHHAPSLTTPIILFLDAFKDKWQGSTIEVVLRASKPWKQTL
jgi:hypothetical protein